MSWLDRTRPSAHSWLAGATALLLLMGTYAAAIGARPTTVVLFLAIAALPYAGLLCAQPVGVATTRRALLFAFLVGGAMVLAPPALSDDVYRYLWEGKMWSEGFNPYRNAPEDPALFDVRDAAWTHINHRELITIYPPVSQVLFWLGYRLTGSIVGFKLLALGAHLLCVLLVARIAGEEGPRASFALALNPLALTESAMNGHVDVFAGLCLLLAAWALVRRRPWVAGVSIVGAVGVKLIGFAALPLLTKARWFVPVVIAALSLAMVAPLVSMSLKQEGRSGFVQYSLRWRGNDVGYGLVESTVGALIEQADTSRWLDGMTTLGFDPRRAMVGPRKEIADRSALDAEVATVLLTRMVVVLIVVGLALWLARRECNPLLTLRWVLLVGLFLSPQVHPWYLLWLLPIEFALGRFAVVVWSVSILLTYGSLDLWVAQRLWAPSKLAVMVEYSLVVMALVVEAFIRRNRR